MTKPKEKKKWFKNGMETCNYLHKQILVYEHKLDMYRSELNSELKKLSTDEYIALGIKWGLMEVDTDTSTRLDQEFSKLKKQE